MTVFSFSSPNTEKSQPFSPQSHNPDGSSPSCRHNAEGRDSYDEAAFCIQTCNATANVTDGMGDRVMEITNWQNPWQDCLVTHWEEALRACLPHQVESLSVFPGFPGGAWIEAIIAFITLEWDTGPIFRRQENKFKGVDTDGKWGNWDTLVNYGGVFPFSNHNILTYYGQNRANMHIQSCLQWTVAGAPWAPCLLGWGQSPNLGVFWKYEIMDRLPESTHKF